MTLYTENRGYPYPRDEKEAGNGALHSELLAQAVAADLDALDAAWTAELQHSTMIQTRTSDVTGIFDNDDRTIEMNSVEKQSSGLGLSPSFSGLQVVKGGDGWYHVAAHMRTRAEGAVTAGALHRIIVDVYEPKYSTTVLRERRWHSTFQAGTGDIYNTIEGAFLLRYGDRLRLLFFHTNVASTARVVGSGTGGTRLTATKIVGI